MPTILENIKDLLPFGKKQKETSFKHLGVSESMELVDYVLYEFNNAKDATMKEQERNSNAWKMFTGFDNGQWDKAIVAEMKKEGRNPFQGNFIRSKVEGLAGNIVKNFFDIGYEPVDGVHTDLTRKIVSLMLSDKELMNWNASYINLVINGLIHLGVEEIFVSDRYDPLGRIGFRSLLPGHIILDPYWLSNDSWDLKRAWKVGYLTSKQIKETYDTKSEEVDIAIQMSKGRATDYEDYESGNGFPRFSLNDKYGDQYRVIEFKHVEREKKKIEFIVADGIIVPEGTDEYKKEWAILNGVDLSQGVSTKTENVDVLYVTTICPQISRSLVLEDKKSLIQIGRIDLFPWSSARYNGTNSGIPELLQSLQETYNKRESQVDFIIASNAACVAMDPDIVGGNSDAMDEIMKNVNKPNYKFWTEPGALKSGRSFFQPLPKNQIDIAIVNELTRMVDMADRVSKQPAAMAGRSEGSEENGILFARKQMQAEVAHTVLFRGLEQHWNDKGEAYILLAKQLYSGAYREFYEFGSGEKIELNTPVVTPEGEVKENDISQLPRVKVVVTQSPEGVTNRTVDRSMNIELLRVLPPDTSPIQRVRATVNAMKTMSQSKVDRAQTEADGEMELMLARKNIQAQIMNLDFQMAQIQSQMAMIGQPQMMGGVGQPQQGSGGQQQAPQRGQGNPEQTVQGNDVSAMNLQ